MFLICHITSPGQVLYDKGFYDFMVDSPNSISTPSLIWCPQVFCQSIMSLPKWWLLIAYHDPNKFGAHRHCSNVRHVFTLSCTLARLCD